MVTIKKVYNNNVILAFENSSKKEVILTGCGIGFGKKPNDTIDDSKIEKKFVIQDNNFESKVNKLASEIPEEVFAVSSAIIEYAEKNLHMIYPEDSNILIYKGESNDYFRQYESVNSGK